MHVIGVVIRLRIFQIGKGQAQVYIKLIVYLKPIAGLHHWLPVHFLVLRSIVGFAALVILVGIPVAFEIIAGLRAIKVVGAEMDADTMILPVGSTYDTE